MSDVLLLQGIPTLGALLDPPQGILILVLAILLIALVAYIGVSKLRAGQAATKAGKILEEARQEADRVRKAAAVEAKEEVLKRRDEIENELQEARKEVRENERRLSKREDALERKGDVLNKKEKYIEKLEESLAGKRQELNDQQANLEKLIEQEMITLRKIANLSQEEATNTLMKRLEQQMDKECAELISRRLEEARESAERQSKRILGIAIQRYAAEITVENVVASVALPNDEMKGRIIGREGRNIRAFEKETGVDVIVDDTPGVVVVSGFDGVRREIARRAMEKLVTDGRIHPARIEELVAQTRTEVEQLVQQSGKEAAFELGIANLHPKAIELLGRLRFRTSYGQNVLQHSIEVAYLAGSLASELGLDAVLAKRAGLLHDIGKAIDQETEGGHAEIGADMARRCEESADVVEAIGGHHSDTEPASIYTILVTAADAISAARPGARRESLEKYIKRLQRLEEIAGAFPGVETAYAIQAGREVRVLVNAGKLDDKSAAKVCRDIANQIQDEMTYPGEIKVTLIRELRFVEVAK